MLKDAYQNLKVAKEDQDQEKITFWQKMVDRLEKLQSFSKDKKVNEGLFSKTVAFNVYKKNKKTGYYKKLDTVFYPSDWTDAEVKHELTNRRGFEPSIVVDRGNTKESIFSEDSDPIETSMINNVKDALMSLKMSGETKVPTEIVLNDFRDRGLDISVEELQELFPAGNEFLKSVNKDFIEFETGHENLVKPDADTVSKMAKKAIDKRV